MPMIMAMPMMNRMALVASRVRVAWTEAASAKMTTKKKTTATAMAPNTVMIFTVLLVLFLPI